MSKMIFVLLFLITWSYADVDISTDKLKEMIENADAIVEGKFVSPEKIKVIDAIKGPQTLSNAKISEYKGDALESERTHIIFMKLQRGNFSVINTITSDVLIKTSIREQVMQSRVKNSDGVVMAKVLDIYNVPIKNEKNEKYSVAFCETVQVYKGNVNSIFVMVYRSNRKEYPKRLFLFRKLNYIFFLQKKDLISNITLPKKDIEQKYPNFFASASDNYSINYYDGALADRAYFIKEVVDACSATSSFDSNAGKDHQGLKIIGRLALNEVQEKKPITTYLLVQNISSANLEICNNHIPYFLKLYIVDMENNKIVVNGKEISSGNSQKNYVTLAPNHYVVTPPINLLDYSPLSKGKYAVYAELDMPETYKLEKKGIWTGKIMTTQMEVIIK